MKKIAMALFFPILNGVLHAQVLAPGPVNPDIPWYTACSTAGVYISGLNTAMIDFKGYNPRQIPPGTLIVSAYQGNGTNGGVVFTEVASGFSIQVPYCPAVPPPPPPIPTYYKMWSPDIIVGNVATNPLTDFRVAVAFVDNLTWAPRIDQLGEQ